jgi:predicted Zn-dependent protease
MKPVSGSRFPVLLQRLLAALVLVCATPALIEPAGLHAQNLPNLGGSDGEELSPLMERRLGEQVMNNIRRDPDYVDDLAVLDYLNLLGGTLLASSAEARGDAGYDFFFFAVRDGSLNAFALPGGFIGAHSGLVLAAQSESELASVLAHEIGHVSQRHIARMIGNQRQDSLLPIAGLLLAALAMRTSPDLSAAALMGGTGLAAQRQLSFGRDAEREADRVGLQILRNTGFELNGMVSFFGRLQNASRNRSDNLPSYLRTHPMTGERMADIEARIRSLSYKQHVDSLDFALIRSRLRVLQDDSPQGWRNAAQAFDEQVRQGSRMQVMAAKYGLAMIAQRQRDLARASVLVNELRAEAARTPSFPASQALTSFVVEQALAGEQSALALSLAKEARAQFPLSRALAMQYADALLAAGKKDEATDFLRDQAQLYRQDSRVQRALARAYAEQGKVALQHLALAEYYSLTGALPAALEQLRIARGASDASFYDQAMIDARERELQASWREVMEKSKKR